MFPGSLFSFFLFLLLISVCSLVSNRGKRMKTSKNCRLLPMFVRFIFFSSSRIHSHYCCSTFGMSFRRYSISSTYTCAHTHTHEVSTPRCDHTWPVDNNTHMTYTRRYVDEVYSIGYLFLLFFCSLATDSL